MKTLRNILLLLCFGFAPEALCAESHAGRVVWWGDGGFFGESYFNYTNGVIELGDEILKEAIGVAVSHGGGLVLKSDGTVVGCGRDWLGMIEAADSLSNVMSVAIEGNSAWAIKRDGTVSRLGSSDKDDDNIVAGLSNITAIAWAGYRSYLALQADGTVMGFRFEPSLSFDPATGLVIDPTTGLPTTTPREPLLRPVKVRGQLLSEVAALASGYIPTVLKKDGTVFRLGYQTLGAPPREPGDTQSDENSIILDLGTAMMKAPFDYTLMVPVKVGGKALNGVTALASSGGHVLALKSNGTVVAWGKSEAAAVPKGLSNVIAIAAAENFSLALKGDGTVAAWGGNDSGQTSVPAGLSNVVAIAAGGWFSMAITTGAVPASVYVQPRGRLEEMERETDLVFKGQVISTRAITNASFPDWAKPHATRFRLVSVLKGKPETNEPVLWHYTAGPMAWGGGDTPSWYQFETGQCYLVFAAKLDRPDYLYTPPSDATNRPNEYRQLYRDCVTRTLDARPFDKVSIKEAHWLELNRLLNDAVPTNSLYAIQRLNGMSKSCLASWGHSGDFKREAVLSAVMPSVTNTDDKVAVAAIGCFQIGGNTSTWINDQGGWIPILRGCAEVQPECVSQVAPYAPALVRVANESPSPSRRMAAVAAFSCTRFPIVSNALPRWLRDSADEVRAQAVLLLPDFPGEFSEHWLREMASDASPAVRAVTADAIGNGTMTNLLPTLVRLFSDPVGRDHPLPPLTVDDLEAGGRASISGDVHTSAGFALLEFDVSQVGDILRTNLSNRGFRLSFIRKLAPDGDKSYLPLLAQELKTHTAGSEQEAAKNGFHWGLSYWLSGNYGWAWDTLFSYVSAQTRGSLSDPQIVAMLDALQIADDPGEARTRSLYEFLLDKGLIERAKELRRGIIRRTEDKAIDKKSFGFPEKLKLFDEMDEKHSLKPGLGI